eukprot:3660612-Amphidinium_carterae.3
MSGAHKVCQRLICALCASCSPDKRPRSCERLCQRVRHPRGTHPSPRRKVYNARNWLFLDTLT